MRGFARAAVGFGVATASVAAARPVEVTFHCDIATSIPPVRTGVPLTLSISYDNEVGFTLADGSGGTFAGYEFLTGPPPSPSFRLESEGVVLEQPLDFLVLSVFDNPAAGQGDGDEITIDGGGFALNDEFGLVGGFGIAIRARGASDSFDGVGIGVVEDPDVWAALGEDVVSLFLLDSAGGELFAFVDGVSVIGGGFGGLADFNGDGVIDVFDLIEFLVAFAATSPTADFNGDGATDVFDLIDFLVAFAATG